MMNGRENPVTRPSVFRTQDAQGASLGGDYASSALFSSPYAHQQQQQPTLRSHAAVSARAGRTTPIRASPLSAGGGVLGRSALVDAYTFAENLPRQLTNANEADSSDGLHRIASPKALDFGTEVVQRPSSVRTFSQLSPSSMNSPTSAFYSADVPLSVWAEHGRAAPMSPGDSSVSPLPGGEAVLQRPIGPDTIREAVYAYLEATGKHDVVMAMLSDERRQTQRSLTTATPTPSAPLLTNPSYPADVSMSGGEEVPCPRRAGPRGAAGAELPAANSVPSSGSQVQSGFTSMSGISGNGGRPFNPPPREVASQNYIGGSTYLPGGLEGKRGRLSRSHDLLRKGLLVRGSLERPQIDEHLYAAEGGRPSLHSSTRRGHASNSASRPSSPSLLGGAGLSSSDAVPGVPHPGKELLSQRQHLPKVFPTLCGLEEAVRPDLILLFSNLEKKITEQYLQLSIPPPCNEVLRYILTQAYEPMWSVGEDANVYHLFPPANPVTGMVLYGTLNQMVEQLTQVHVMSLSTPPNIIVKSGQSFCQAFLRCHRLLMPSHVLLAKLMERYLVPLSLHLGFERFKVHGITVHIPGLGASLPPRRSQSETVLHGRRHPGTAAGAAATGGPLGGLTSSGGGGGGESGVGGSRSARQPQAGIVREANRMKPATSEVVEEYVRASAAATSPGAALMAMVRAGMFANATNGSVAALTNAAISTAPATMPTGNPTSTTKPHRSALGGTLNAAASAVAAYEVPGLSSLLNDGSIGVATSRPAVELVTTYSTSAALWLTVCERVQLKVLSVLLYWLQHHPNHFDDEMLRSVLHFVESCCYRPSEWADCPSRHSQIAEFIRQACHAALPPSSRRLGGPGETFSLGELATFPPMSKEWREGVLSGTWERCRYQLLSEAVPPSLRYSVKAELLPWTWVTPMGSLTPRQYLPCFAFCALPLSDVMSFPGEERHQHYYQQGHRRSSEAATQAATDVNSGMADATKLYTDAHDALRLFGSCTFETYVRGLTAAHYRMFTAFPSQDVFIAAQHTSSSYLTSPAFQSSFLGRFLNSSAFLTSWCVSLLLHAACIDGARAAAMVAVTNLSILNSFVGDATDYRAHVAGDGVEEGEAAGGGSSAHSRSSSHSSRNSSLSSASVATASVQGASQDGSDGATAAAAAAMAVASHNDFLRNPARQFLHVLGRLMDLVVGFLRVNNLHASYSIFRGFNHPFVKKLLQHRRISAHIHAQTAQRIWKLEGFFTSAPFTSAVAAATGQTSSQAGRAASAGGSGGGAGGTVGSTKQPAGSAAAAAGVGDPTVDDDLDAPGNEGNTETGAAPFTSENMPHRSHKPHHSFFEYLNTVPDSVEYPTVPVVQYYLRELQMMFALEPTFFTVPSHEMQSRFVAEEVRLTGVFTVPSASLEEEQTPMAMSPIAVVNWRKMHLVDDWIQRVNSNQMSCLHYISSRSTVVRNIMPDLEFEKAFDEQLSRVVVTNTNLLQEMANQLYCTL